VNKKIKFLLKKNYLEAKKDTPMFYVYILECLDGSYYTGFTGNLLQRVTDHRMGNGSAYTLKKGFKKLVYFEHHVDKTFALKREKQIKGAGRTYKNILVNKFQQNLHLLI